MSVRRLVSVGTVAIAMLSVAGGISGVTAIAQEQTAAADPGAPASQTPEPLSADELEILVARIALYPDELIAVISAAALYPLQIVEAARFLDDYAKDKNLKPKDSWDGSVISLLNYPEVVKMMSDDLEWTQTFGDAIAFQQKDVLIAIQQLREEAVAKGIIKTDDKVKVETSGDNIVIQPVSTEKIYVPQYEPEMLYSANYPIAPVSYYPEPYPSYWYPGATFFAAAVTGAVWAAAVDWDDWGVWGGRWDGGDIDVDCNRCFNNRDFNGKVNFNDIDWKNVDRSKLNIDRNQLAKFDRTNIRNKVKANNNNAVRNRAANIRNERKAALPARAGGARDVRKSTLEGLKGRPGDGSLARQNVNRPDAGRRPDVKRPAGSKPSISKPAVKKGTHVNRPVGKSRPAARVDHRPKSPSSLGHVNRGKVSSVHSNRGHHSMGGGYRGGGRPAVHRGGGGGHRAVHRGGGRRR